MIIGARTNGKTRENILDCLERVSKFLSENKVKSLNDKRHKYYMVISVSCSLYKTICSNLQEYNCYKIGRHLYYGGKGYGERFYIKEIKMPIFKFDHKCLGESILKGFDPTKGIAVKPNYIEWHFSEPAIYKDQYEIVQLFQKKDLEEIKDGKPKDR